MKGPAKRATRISWGVGQVIRDYHLHPEHKFTAPDGGPCRRGTTGMLQRRPVHTAEVRRIGKEANKLDDVQAGLVASLGDVLNDYQHRRHKRVSPAGATRPRPLQRAAAGEARRDRPTDDRPHPRGWEAASAAVDAAGRACP